MWVAWGVLGVVLALTLLISRGLAVPGNGAAVRGLILPLPCWQLPNSQGCVSFSSQNYNPPSD